MTIDNATKDAPPDGAASVLTVGLGLAGRGWRILNTPIIDMLIGTQPRDCDDDAIHKRWTHAGMPCPACLATLQVKAKPLARPNVKWGA